MKKILIVLFSLSPLVSYSQKIALSTNLEKNISLEPGTYYVAVKSGFFQPLFSSGKKIAKIGDNTILLQSSDKASFDETKKSRDILDLKKVVELKQAGKYDAELKTGMFMTRNSVTIGKIDGKTLVLQKQEE